MSKNNKKKRKFITNQILYNITQLDYLFYSIIFIFFFFNDTATTEIYTLSLHDALPIRRLPARPPDDRGTPAAGTVLPGAGRLSVAGRRRAPRIPGRRPLHRHRYPRGLRR